MDQGCQMSQFHYPFKGLGMENFGIFYDHFGILSPVVNFVTIWYLFSCFGMFYQEKLGNPA
jgi:hypothetical protein